VQVQEFSVESLFGALRGMFRPLVNEQAAVSLVFDVEGKLPVFKSDEGKLAQVLRNFISNALKFTQRGEVRIVASQAEPGQVRIAVIDTGIGIAAENQTRIFEEFEQVAAAQRKDAHGTGLGLPLTRRLAALLGGRVELKSALGEGSTFSIVLPAQWPGLNSLTVEAGAVLHEAAPKPALTSGIDPTSVAIPLNVDGWREPLVLVVDDDEATRYIVAETVREAGCAPITAPDGESSLKAAKQNRPAAVVLDLMMPGMTGDEVLRRLHEDKDTSRIPIIINTSKHLSALEADSLRSRAVAIVDKSTEDKGARCLKEALYALRLGKQAGRLASKRSLPRHA
jgi:CheY-like chemotaxis protein